MNLLNRFKLKGKLLLLGIIPAAVLAIILAAYLTSTRLNDMYELLHKTNENLSHSIAESSINGVFSGNTDSLKTIINSVINEPDIVSIKITNNAGKTLAYATSKIATSHLVPYPSKRIIQPIKLNTMTQTDEFDNLLGGPLTKSSETIGYVDLALSYNAIEQRQKAILLNTVYITVFLLFIIGLITKFFSNAISRPILQLTTDVKNITKGHYIPPSYTFYKNNNNEIAILANGIHEMAHQINDHQQVLEKKILEATQELRSKNDKLFSAQEEIVKAAEAKSRFISHISHEIRTPLNGIIGFLEIIQHTKLDNEQIKLLNASYLSSKNLLTIVNEVLDFAQLEAGKVLINKTNFELKKAVQDSLLLLSSQAKANEVTIDYHQDPDVPKHIHQDAVKFGQILINLVSNAIKYSHRSTVTVQIKVNAHNKNNIDVSVIDHGIGINEEDIKQLFKEYSQLDGATSDQGSGLGLVITKQLLNALHGTIEVNSVLGKGSTFTFTLPFTAVKDSYIQLKAEAETEDTLPDLTSLNVLVADDNEINRLLLSTLLERQQATVTCVNDGQQAIEKASQQPFDLMLFDLRMPIKMGNEALFEIRSQPDNPNYQTPAIAITAHITSGEEKAQHINSFDGYLIKPIDQTEFFTLLEQLLKEHDYAIQPFVLPNKNNPSDTENKIFDYDLAKRSMNSDPAFMLVMLEKFFSELPKQNEKVQALIKQEEFIEAAEITHKVHGSAAYCGTPALKKSAKQLEIVLREKDEEKIRLSHKRFYLDIKALLIHRKNILTPLK
ncbi:MAG: ATP-binding protein [Cycloclasticus sp.]